MIIGKVVSILRIWQEITGSIFMPSISIQFIHLLNKLPDIVNLHHQHIEVIRLANPADCLQEHFSLTKMAFMEGDYNVPVTHILLLSHLLLMLYPVKHTRRHVVTVLVGNFPQ